MFNKINILKLFFEEPNRVFYLREIARIANKSPATIEKYLKKLEKENIIIKIKDKVYTNYRSNTDSLLYKQNKIHYNILKLLKSGLIDFLDEEYLYPTIILFGSYARGEDIKRSDIDLFILTNTKKELKLNKFEKILKKEIQLFVMNDKEFKDNIKKNPDLTNNIINGARIKGYLKVF